MNIYTTLSSNLLPAIVVNFASAALAYRSGAVRKSGILGGIPVGMAIFLFLGWRGFLILATFFAAGSAVTRLGISRKQSRGLGEEKGGARGASHALANCSAGILFSFLAIFTGRAEFLAGFTASFATALFDTGGTELGSLYGKHPVKLIPLRRAVPGERGAVSLEGTILGLCLSALLSLTAFATGLVSLRLVPAIILSAFCAGMVESLAGGAIGGRRGGHTLLNLLNTFLGGGLGVILSRVFSF